jgi:aspartate oxidase
VATMYVSSVLSAISQRLLPFVEPFDQPNQVCSALNAQHGIAVTINRADIAVDSDTKLQGIHACDSSGFNLCASNVMFSLRKLNLTGVAVEGGDSLRAH